VSGTAIDIDVGGTFTDCYLSSDSRVAWGKAPTTPDDLSRGFFNALGDASAQLGLDVDAVLGDADILRYSTTIALNALIQRVGPRLGLITTSGFEDILSIGNGHAWGDGLPVSEQRRAATARMPESPIPRELVVGVNERIDAFGEVIRPLREDDVLAAVQRLVDQGVRGIVVVLMWSPANPVHEQRIREIVDEEYPETYLGNMPVILSSEVVPKWKEYTRATTTMLTAFMHGEMTRQLMQLGDRLRDTGYGKPLQIVHNAGGVAKLSRTRAIDSYQSGPVAGLMGSASRGRELGFENVICTDMGGTSFDLGVVVGGRPRFYTIRPVVDRWAVDVPLLEVQSIGAGGGSIAWLNRDFGDRLEVGPQSAGSLPGPACYDLGGQLPTVTDADVVLGYIDPDEFLDGRLTLDAEAAADAIRDEIADPLGMTVEQAAFAIKRVVDEKMGAEIFKEVALKGHDPKEFTLFAYGGAGATHCCGYASALGIGRIVVFPESPVFCAFGASTLDVTHVYERARPMVLFDPMTGELLSDLGAFNEVVAELRAELERDMTAEGLDLRALSLRLELEIRHGSSPVTQRLESTSLALDDEEDVRKLYRTFRAGVLAQSEGVDLPEGRARIETFVLHGSVPRPGAAASGARSANGKPGAAPEPSARRAAVWDADGTRTETPVYRVADLPAGTVLTGPALGQARDTTYVIPPGWTLRTLDGGAGELSAATTT
jgi:N-methylhydantoinase A/oxoprolinase/acetone carboxylase beta subunit